jgi:hypothetical protein
VGFLGFFMWASWVAFLYIFCVLMDALRFFLMQFSYSKKKKKKEI